MYENRCGYCNEEIYTRYAATYHNKYKHPGEARNFIKDEQDVSIYYVNRARKSTNNNGSNGSSKGNEDCEEAGQSSMSHHEDDEHHQYGVVGRCLMKKFT